MRKIDAKILLLFTFSSAVVCISGGGLQAAPIFGVGASCGGDHSGITPLCGIDYGHTITYGVTSYDFLETASNTLDLVDSHDHQASRTSTWSAFGDAGIGTLKASANLTHTMGITGYESPVSMAGVLTVDVRYADTITITSDTLAAGSPVTVLLGARFETHGFDPGQIVEGEIANISGGILASHDVTFTGLAAFMSCNYHGVIGGVPGGCELGIEPIFMGSMSVTVPVGYEIGVFGHTQLKAEVSIDNLQATVATWIANAAIFSDHSNHALVTVLTPGASFLSAGGGAYNLETAEVPEPTTAALLSLAGMFLWIFRKKICAR